MAGQSGFSENPGGRRIDHGQCATAEAYVDPLRRRVIPNVVRVVAQMNDGAGPMAVGAEQLQALALPVCDSDRPRVGYDGDSLRFAKPGKALEMRQRLRVEDLDRVVAERRDVQPAGRGIEGQMIDSPVDAWQVDCPDEHERSFRGG